MGGGRRGCLENTIAPRALAVSFILKCSNAMFQSWENRQTRLSRPCCCDLSRTHTFTPFFFPLVFLLLCLGAPFASFSTQCNAIQYRIIEKYECWSNPLSRLSSESPKAPFARVCYLFSQIRVISMLYVVVWLWLRLHFPLNNFKGNLRWHPPNAFLNFGDKLKNTFFCHL